MRLQRRQLNSYDFSKFEPLHEQNGLFVNVTMAIKNEVLNIHVINNNALCKEEEARIIQRLRAAKKFNSIEEVLTYGFDQTEGGGYGLIIIILMLRKINLDERAFALRKGKDVTLASLSIPLNLITQEHGKMIADAIVKEIDRMPQFPESIVRLQKTLSDPNCDFRSVAQVINTDPALATEVIRIANSPIYMVPNKVKDVISAVRLVGLKGIRSLLLSYGAKRVFEEQYDSKKIQEVMDHSYRVAVIASTIARMKNLKMLYEDIYIASLLHDFGKIVVNALKEDLVSKLQALCNSKHIPIAVLEDLTDGYNHSIIGGQLAAKWSFPEKFANAIRYHHIPLEAPEDFKVITFATYLGNEIYYFEKGERNQNDISFQVLKFFGLAQKPVFDNLIERLATQKRL